MRTVILEDVLESGLRLVICGTAAGARSARLRMPYSGRGNRFWSVLFEVGLSSEPLGPCDFKKLLGFGIGLTDLAKYTFGSDASLALKDFEREAFDEKINLCKPRVVAFNGKKAASIYFARPTRDLLYGQQPSEPGQPVLWVLPSTSGSARRFWDAGHWRALAKVISEV